MKNVFRFRILALSLVFLSSIGNSTFAEPVGELVTLEGLKYEVDHFGSDQQFKEYFVRAGKKHIPINEVKNIARVKAGNAAVGYLVILKNGEIHDGRIGFLFYEKVKFKGSHSGQVKIGYVPVMKDRGQDGLIFTTKDVLNHRNRTVEISNPNIIEKLALFENFRRNDIALNSHSSSLKQ